VVLGNTLAVEVREVWHTPAHILGSWGWKLGRSRHPLVEPANDNEPAPISPGEAITAVAEIITTQTEPPPAPKPLGEQMGLF